MPVESFFLQPTDRACARFHAPWFSAARRQENRLFQLLLIETMQEVALILAAVETAQKFNTVVGLTHARIVAGGNLLCTQFHGVVQNALNLISELHSTSGLGVRPAWYSRRNSENTRSLYSLAKFTASRSMPIFSAALAASRKSWRLEQYSLSSSSSQFS